MNPRSTLRVTMDKLGRWLSAGGGAVVTLGAGLLAVALYLFYSQRATGNFGFPLDDSWIHLQIARNVATGHGWSYNPGEPTGASTSPLWVLLLAPLFWLPGDVTVWVKALGSLLYLANVWLVADLTRRITGDRRVAWLAGLLTAWGPTAVWGALSGMEVHLYLLLTLLGLRAAVAAHAAGRPGYATTLWLGLAGWARPELWALLPVAWAYLWWPEGVRQSGAPPTVGDQPAPAGGAAADRPRQELRTPACAAGWWLHLLLAAAFIGGFLAFNLGIWGRPLPGTWYAKIAFGAGNEPVSLLQRGLHFLSQLMSSLQAAVYSQNPLLAVTLALGGAAVWRAGPAQRRGLALLIGVAVAACVAAAVADLGSVGLQHYRRAAHLVAMLHILAAAGAVALWNLLHNAALLAEREGEGGTAETGRGRRGAVGAWLLAAAVLLMQLAGLRQGAILCANDTRSINQGDVAAAQWIAANTPADALVAVNDIGALAYFGRRRIVDLVGLASPEVVAVTSTSRPGSAEREARLRDLLLDLGVDYIVMFPEWFPYLAADPALAEVTRFTVPRASALAYDSVVVYRLGASEPTTR